MGTKISELPSAAPLQGIDTFPVVQGGVTKKALVSDLPTPGGTGYATVITESTTARTLSLNDAGAYIRHTSASASTVTVAPQSSVAWVANTEIHIRRAASGDLTLTPSAGVTLNAPSGGTLVMTNAMSVTLKRVGTDVWDVIGQTVAV